MASYRLLFFSSLSLLLFNVVSSSSALRFSKKLGGTLGGRTRIPDVATNKEVHDLGRFAVDEHNRNSSKEGSSTHPLSFTQVVEAQRQVVAGIKYFLTIAAKDNHGAAKTFDAVVLVPLAPKPKELLSFTPSPN